MKRPRTLGQRPRAEARRLTDAERDKARPWRRWYGLAIWKSIRTHQLAEHPLCARCLDDGRVVLATVVNHVDPHRGDWDKFISGPFESCCKPCHDSIVQREERAAARLERDRRGGGSKV
jgi:5-methylcytosine-specific restriction protein A